MGRKELPNNAKARTTKQWVYKCCVCFEGYYKSSTVDDPNQHAACYRRYCTVCQTIFATEEDNKNHCRDDHSEEYKYFCFECNECFHEYDPENPYFKEVIDTRFISHQNECHRNKSDLMMYAMTQLRELYDKWEEINEEDLEQDWEKSSKFLQWVIGGLKGWKKPVGKKSYDKCPYLVLRFEVGNGKKWNSIYEMVVVNNTIHTYDGETCVSMNLLERLNIQFMDWEGIVNNQYWDDLLQDLVDTTDYSDLEHRIQFMVPRKIPNKYGEHIDALLNQQPE